jgi:hypothetical protein
MQLCAQAAAANMAHTTCAVSAAKVTPKPAKHTPMLRRQTPGRTRCGKGRATNHTHHTTKGNMALSP